MWRLVLWCNSKGPGVPETSLLDATNYYLLATANV